jgi:hypothetical protein
MAAAYGTSETGTATQGAILQRGRPVRAAPHGWPPEIISVSRFLVQFQAQGEKTPGTKEKCLRCPVPVLCDPLKVEVEIRPQNFGNPCPVLLLGLDQPFRVFEQDIGAEWRPIFQRERSSSV